LFVGSKSIEKGVIHLVDAIKQVWKKNPNLILILVGSSTKEFEDYISRQTIEVKKKIFVIDVVDDEEKSATFYLPTKKGINNNFKIDFFSIPPITIEIWFEGTIEKKIEVGILSLKSVELKIDSSKVKDSISEIYVTTDRLWFSNKITKQDKSILLSKKN